MHGKEIEAAKRRREEREREREGGKEGDTGENVGGRR